MSDPDVEVPLPDLDAIQADLAAVDDALRAIENDKYGTCAVCGQPVDDVNLAERPLHPVCGVHFHDHY